MTKYTYLLIDFFTIIVPFIFSFHPRLMFWKNIKAFVPACLVTSLFFLAWDAIFTKIGVWGFNEDYVLGWFIAGMPIEEILFFICIPYACVFSYHCFGILFPHKFRHVKTKVKSISMILGALAFCFVYHQQLYTLVNFAVFALLIFYLAFVKKVHWLGQFYVTYLVMIIPFFVVNGLLTGTGLAAPIVWYNSAEIIGVRMLTIPFEDTFYGMTLIGINIFLYEHFLAKMDARKI